MAATMRTARIERFGGPDVIQVETAPTPSPGAGEVLVRVHAAGVGPWDSWIRSGKSAVDQPLPLTLGSDLAGRVAAVGEGVTGLTPGEAVFGVTNGRFTGGNADYALCEADRLARKPASLTDVEAASAPVVSVTAWQMLFDEARLEAGQSVLIHGALGSVGRYAVQLGRGAQLKVFATARPGEEMDLQALGVDGTVALGADGRRFDAVLDYVGGATQAKLFPMLRPGGALISAVAAPDADLARAHEVRAKFMLVDVRAGTLQRLAEMFDQGRLQPWVGPVLPLTEAVTAHRMLDGDVPRPPGKIVLITGAEAGP